MSRMVATSVNILVANMFLSRYLDRVEYGTFQQTWFLTHMILEIALLGIPVGLLYFLPNMTEEKQKGLLLRLSLSVVAIGAVVALLIYGIAPLAAERFSNPALERTLRTFALYAFFALPGLPMDSFLIARNRHSLLGGITLMHSVLLVAAIILPAAAGLPLSMILWAIAGYGLMKSGLLTGGAFFSLRRVRGEVPVGFLKPFLAYSAPIGINDLLRVLSRWLDKNIVSLYFKPETFAIYANGAIEIPFVNVFAGAISAVVIPEFSRLSRKGADAELIALWHRAILKTGALLLPLFVYLMAVAPSFLVFLFSESYRPSSAPFRIYLILLPLRCATYTPILLALGRSRLVAIGALVDVLANLGLSILLIPRFSYLGPAIATVITTYGQAGFYLWWAGRILNLGLSRIFPWRSLARLGLIAVAPALLLLLAMAAGRGAFVTLALGALLYFPPFALLIWKYGPLSSEDRDFVLRLLRKVIRR